MEPRDHRFWRIPTVIMLAAAGDALAEETADIQSEATVAPAAEYQKLGLNIDVGWASVYNWRGLNLYKDSEQSDQNGFLSPSITYQITDALSIGYWGGFQLNGDNSAQLLDAAYSGEQDLVARYSLDIAEGTSINFGFITYLYPMADEREAGVATPTYLEPAVGLSWAGPVDLGMKAAWYYGVQDALSASRYVYLTPTVGKSFALSSKVGLGLSAGVGYKLFTGAGADENTLDLAFTAAVPIAVGSGFYVKPAIGGAWTNLEKNGKGGDAGFADEAFVFGSVNVGLDL